MDTGSRDYHRTSRHGVRARRRVCRSASGICSARPIRLVAFRLRFAAPRPPASPPSALRGNRCTTLGSAFRASLNGLVEARRRRRRQRQPLNQPARLTTPQPPETRINALRPSHLPNHRERTALQLLRTHGELPILKLHPTGLATVSKMVEKAWIERVGSDVYRLTPAEEAALRAELPD